MTKKIKKPGTKITLVKDIMYKVIDLNGNKIKQDLDKPKIFYIHQK